MSLARSLALGCTAAVGSIALIGCHDDMKPNDMDRGESMGIENGRDKAMATPGSTGTKSDPGQMRSSGPGGSGGVGQTGGTTGGSTGGTGSMNGGGSSGGTNP